MDVVLVSVIVALVVMFVSAPLRRAASASGPAAELRDLEAAREAKYREIRDAELDHRMGKLSDADYTEVDTSLRAEAVQILRAIDTIGER